MCEMKRKEFNTFLAHAYVAMELLLMKDYGVNMAVFITSQK